MVVKLLRHVRARFLKPKKPTPPFKTQILKHPKLKKSIHTRQKTKLEKQADRRVVQSVATVGLAAANPFVSLPLGAIAAGSLISMLIPVIRDWSTKLVKEKKLDPNIIWTTGALGLIATNHILLSASCAVLYHSGRKLVLRTEDQSRNELINIMGEQPSTVWVLKDGVEIEVPFNLLQVGDVLIVSAGQVIPVDGEIISGEVFVDQQRLTGEAQPVEKASGDQVLAATVVLSGQIKVEVQKTGSQTVATQIGQVLNDTVDYRSTTVLRSQSTFEQMTLPVLGTAATATVLFGPVGGVAILCNMPVTALGFISSLNVLTHLKKTSQAGVLVKDGRALEMLNEVDTVVFDKTGTLTLEELSVGTIHSTGTLSQSDLLCYAASVEVKQSHPIALALCQAAYDQKLELHDFNIPDYEIGYGIAAQVNQHLVHVGSERFMDRNNIVLQDDARQRQIICDADGVSLIYVALDGQLEGVIELHTTIRPEARDVVSSLQSHGLNIAIISGDREQPTRKIAHQLGIGSYFAEVLPQDKGDIIDQLQAQGHKVCFIGDGLNDTIALKKAKTSISFSGATSAATDTAQMILMDGNLLALPKLFKISGQFNANTNRTLWALLAPVGVSTFGVFFLHTGVAFAGAAYYVALSGGFLSALLPAWKKSKKLS